MWAFFPSPLAGEGVKQPLRRRRRARGWEGGKVSTSVATPAITLKYVKTIGIVNNGYNGRGFANPYNVAVSRDGRIFVLNRCDPARAAAIRVGICTLDEEYLGEFGKGAGSGDGRFAWAVAMAFASQQRL